MPSGETYVTTVDEGLDTVVATARTTREFPADVMLKVCDRQTLPEGTGTAWREFLAAALTGQNYGETDEIDNPQELDGSILSATPQLVAIQTFIGDRVVLRLNKKAFATFGQVAQEALQRLKDRDGHSVFASATTTLGGTGTTATSGQVLAALTRIQADVDEPGPEPLYVVAHGYQHYDIQAEVLAGVGTYPVPDGYTAEAFMRGWKGNLGGAQFHVDGLIEVDSTPDVRGGIFSKMALLCVQGKAPWTDKRYEPQKGYGGWNTWLKDEYIWAERSAGNWLYGWLNDGTAPSG